ncbi:hypothetical protein ACBJ59_03050 [Nonomuraea sp. MTCD27]|uniref:hypothetical protein n=1 Tax=Nonomuraea sp. MTCD27 TaxID=1676747 RepID=UPI0035C20321
MTLSDWRQILSFAHAHSRNVTVHLTSGAAFTGIATGLGMDLVVIEQHDPETGKDHEHHLAFHAIVAITLAPED